MPDAESVLNYKLEQRAEGTVEVAEKRDGDHITTGEPAQIVSAREIAWPLRFIISVYREVIRSARNLMSNLPDIPKMANTLSASDATLTKTRASRSGE